MEKTELIVAISVLLLASFIIDYIKYEERPIVKFSSGSVQGTFGLSSDTYRKYKAFYGIPYARPPVGELRFEPPEPIDSWSDIKDAGKWGAQCLQTEILFTGLVYGSEDCLFLNVFVPFTKISTDVHKLPVLVFFHGGYWHVGSSEEHGEKRFMEKDVILVTVNYRLGALGFLSTGDADGIRGNMGLKDQVLALKWIQNNIASFGGDPSQVTIFGESVGAASVHLHMMSPLSKGLFHRAISQSGTGISLFATYNKVKAQAKRFAAKLKCPTGKQAEMIKCLKNIDAHELVSVHQEALDVIRHRETLFAPTVEINNETSFLVEDPLQTLLNGNFQKVPWIVGVNAHEGRFTTAGLSANLEKEKIVRDYKSGLPKLLQYVPNDEVTEKIHGAYVNPNGSKDEYIANLTNLISDRFFFLPLLQSATLHAKQNAPTYVYFFHHQFYLALDFFFYDSQNYIVHPVLHMLLQHAWRFTKEFILRIPVSSPFTCHGDELPLMFTHPWTPSIFSWLPSRDLPLSRNFIDLWTSFASGRPLRVNNVDWEPVDIKQDNLRFLNISLQPSMIDNPFKDRVKFWETIKLEDQ